MFLSRFYTTFKLHGTSSVAQEKETKHAVKQISLIKSALCALY